MHPVSVVRIVQMLKSMDFANAMHVLWPSSTPRRIYSLDDYSQGKYLVSFDPISC